MSLLLNARALSKSFGSRPLFRDVAISVSQGDRVGLIGPNGSGKSTLLKILARQETADEGELVFRQSLRVGYVAQTDRFSPDATPLSALVQAMRQAAGHGDGLHDHDQHEHETQAAILLDKLGFCRLDQNVNELSGGWRKRLAIACQLAGEPDLLLMDEPTNHLDMQGILWLEQWMDDAPMGVVVVTHDRYFLEEATSRIVELNQAFPQGTLAVDGSYSEFLERRSDFLAAQEHQQQALANQVRTDIAWLRRGAKARRTKAKGRIDASAQRMEELQDLKRRNAPAQAAGIDFSGTGRQTRNLLVARGIAKTLGDRCLFAGLDVILSPGMRLGLLGPNGSGKTTLIHVLTGQLPPDAGSIKLADDLKVATFTQRRSELDRRQELSQALCPIGDTLFYRDRAVHVTTWAKKFLFRPDQLNVPVGDLSGGEQARIMIANLMRQPADVLILDEPTNDLDIASLQVLEQSLEEFPGAVLLVTHDRFMLDRLSTDILGLDGLGGARHFASYRQWLAAQQTLESEARALSASSKRPSSAAASPSVSQTRTKRLSYKEQREWDQMESAIQSAETQAQQLERQMNEPTLLADHARLHEHCRKMEQAQALVARLYDRWAELEAKQK